MEIVAIGLGILTFLGGGATGSLFMLWRSEKAKVARLQQSNTGLLAGIQEIAGGGRDRLRARLAAKAAQREG